MTTRESRQRHDVKAQDRAVEALRLRKLGWQYDDIAKKCGYYNRGAAWNAVQRLMNKRTYEAVDDLRRIEAERLDDIMTAFMEGAMRGDKDDAAVVLRVMERRARMFGLDDQVDVMQQINIQQLPDWKNLRDLIFQSLAAFPEARAVVARAVLALGEAEHGRTG